MPGCSRNSDIAPQRFLMVGNSLRSDIAPVLELGGWGVHGAVPHDLAHEAEASLAHGSERMRTIAGIGEAGQGAVRELDAIAAG